MLTLTENAQTAITGIVDQAGAAETGGLRISSAGEEQLNVGIAPAPEQGDEVLDAEGARVFLDPTATLALDDKVLDAAPDDEGRVTFTIAQQG